MDIFQRRWNDIETTAYWYTEQISWIDELEAQWIDVALAFIRKWISTETAGPLWVDENESLHG